MTPQRTAPPLAWLVAALLAAHACGCPGSTVVIGGDDGGDAGLPGDAGDSSDGGPVEVDGGDDGGTADAGPHCSLPLAGRGTLLATGLNGPRRLAIDDRGLYVTESGRIGLDDGRLLRIPFDGGLPQPLLTGLAAPDAVAADGTDIWVLDANALWRVDSATLAQGALLAPVNDAYSGRTELRLTPGDVVVASGERSLARVPKDGGFPQFLYLGDAGEQIPSAVIDQAQVYFLLTGTTARPGLYRVPLVGGGPAVRVRTSPDEGRSLELTSQGLLWSEGDGGLGSVRRDPLDGGAVQTLVSGLDGPEHPLTVGSLIYVRDAAPTQPSVYTFVAGTACGLLPVGPELYGPGDALYVDPQLFFTSPGINQQGTVGVIP